MKEKKTKEKKTGNGFGFRIAQAILYMLIVIGLIIGSVLWYSGLNYNKSFVGWMNHRYRDSYQVDLDNDGYYEDGCYISIYLDNELTVNTGENSVKYEFVAESMKAKELTFAEKETGIVLSVKFSQIEHYHDFISSGGWTSDFDPVMFAIFLGLAAVMGVLTFLQMLSAFLGRKRKGANVISIVIGSVFVLGYGFGVFGIVGGVKGIRALKRTAEEGQKESKQSAQTQNAAVQVPAAQAAQSEITAELTPEEIHSKLLNDYPADYENKPVTSQLLDPDNTENLFLENADGDSCEFRQLYVTLCGGRIYALTETVDLSEEEGGGLIVFRVDYENDEFHVEEDDAVCQKVFDEFKQAVSTEQHYEKQRIKRSDFKLDLYDSNIDEKTWKAFKKTATQEELTVIAIGAKYRVAHSRILNIICAIGIILSIAIFWPTGGWSLIGYPVFAFIATKSIRYEDTYSQSYRLLSKENKAFVDSYYNCNVGLKILDCLIKIATFWMTIPYQAILMLIGMFAPNFAISKNGILVSIPKGQDVGNLGAVGAYYSSFSFIDEALANKSESKSSSAGNSPTDDYYKKKEYTYTDSHGYEQTVYSDDEKNFYDAGGHFVGSGGDGGKFKKKD